MNKVLVTTEFGYNQVPYIKQSLLYITASYYFFLTIC